MMTRTKSAPHAIRPHIKPLFIPFFSGDEGGAPTVGGGPKEPVGGLGGIAPGGGGFGAPGGGGGRFDIGSVLLPVDGVTSHVD